MVWAVWWPRSAIATRISGDTFAYDATGLIRTTRDSKTTWFTNDALGRRIAVRNPNGGGDPSRPTIRAGT